jgi:hypothetical protein
LYIIYANANTFLKPKGLVVYNIENGTFTLNKHVACDHMEEFKKWGGGGLYIE